MPPKGGMKAKADARRNRSADASDRDSGDPQNGGGAVRPYALQPSTRVATDAAAHVPQFCGAPKHAGVHRASGDGPSRRAVKMCWISRRYGRRRPCLLSMFSSFLFCDPFELLFSSMNEQSVAVFAVQRYQALCLSRDWIRPLLFSPSPQKKNSSFNSKAVIRDTVLYIHTKYGGQYQGKEDAHSTQFAKSLRASASRSWLCCLSCVLASNYPVLPQR
jgi:hypothetical protein